MRKIETALPDVYILEPQVFYDFRGYFLETYSVKAFSDICINSTFVQDNQSFTAKKGTLRGLHFQNDPMAQGKLVHVNRGAVLDVAVDLRLGSPNYLKWTSVELTSENKRMLYIPRGFAHGFVTLTDDVEFFYKVDNLYSKEHERSVRFDDPSIGIIWGVGDIILSDKDAAGPLLKDVDCNFLFTDPKEK